MKHLLGVALFISAVSVLPACEKKSATTHTSTTVSATPSVRKSTAAATPSVSQVKAKPAPTQLAEAPKLVATAAPTIVPVAAKAAVEASAPTGDMVLNTLEDFVAALKRELEATAKCSTKKGSAAPLRINECLLRVFKVKKLSWTPPKAAFPDIDAKRELREALNKVFTDTLFHKNLTVRYSALRTGWSSIKHEPAIAKQLEKMLRHADADLAEQAAYARFSRKKKDDTATLALAKQVLAAHKHTRVRLQGCRYVGNRTFQNNRAHFELLKGYAADAKEAIEVRACAVSQLGVIGGEKDVRTLMGFMSDSNLHYAVVYALGRGIRTKRAFDAYLNYFLRHAASGKLSSSPFQVFIPAKRDLAKFDKAKAIRVLVTALKAPSDRVFWVPRLLGKLGAKKELKKALAKIGDTTDDWNKKNLKKQIENELKRLN